MDARLEPGGHTPQLSPDQRGVASGTLRTDRACGPGGGGPTSQAPHTAVSIWASRGCAAAAGCSAAAAPRPGGQEASPVSCSTNGKGTRTQNGAKRGPEGRSGCIYAAPQNLARQLVRKAEATPQPSACWRQPQGPRRTASGLASNWLDAA